MATKTKTTEDKALQTLSQEVNEIKKTQATLQKEFTQAVQAAFNEGFEAGRQAEAEEFEAIAAEIRKAEREFERTYNDPLCDFLKGDLLSDEEVTILVSQARKPKQTPAKTPKSAEKTTSKTPAQPAPKQSSKKSAPKKAAPQATPAETNAPQKTSKPSNPASAPKSSPARTPAKSPSTAEKATDELFDALIKKHAEESTPSA